MSALAQAHIVQQARLRKMVAGGVGLFWGALPAYDEANVPTFLAQTVPLVLGAQRQSAALTNAFLAKAGKRQPIGINPDRISGAGVRGGVTPQEVYRRPFVTVWTALAAGKQWAEAIDAGRARAESTAEMDVQLASFATYGEVQNADPQIRGYQRVADGGACDFCNSIDGAFVLSADASPLHNHCGCGLDPVFDEVTPTPLPDDVAVEDHGELGLVLVDPAHDFTAL